MATFTVTKKSGPSKHSKKAQARHSLNIAVHGKVERRESGPVLSMLLNSLNGSGKHKTE